MTKDITLEPGEVGYFRAPAGQRFDVLWKSPSGSYVKVRATGTTPPPDPDPDPPPPPPPAGKGILVDLARIPSLPTTGKAWDAIKAEAAKSGTYTLASQDSQSNIVCLARAFVAARTGDAAMRAKVIADLRAVKGTTPDRTLALARELAVAPIAAELVGATDAELGYDFRAWLIKVITTTYDSKTLESMTEERPNNWGTHGMGSLAAVYAYTGDAADLDDLHNIVLGWLGDRSKYAGFSYGDLDWQVNPSAPVGINPKGSTKLGHDIDGVLPDDQRRGGGFTWPPPKENYVWEAMQGVTLAAHILERTGRPVWAASDKALDRAARWLHEVCQFPAEGDDTAVVPILNRAYGRTWPVPSPTSPGKSFGFADWWLG